VYVDVTFGGGGHSKEILSRLSEKGKLFAFDQDEDALKNTIDDDRFTLIHENFRYIKRFLRFYGIKKVDGILGDFGVSSHQYLLRVSTTAKSNIYIHSVRVNI
jgi:16S rRNA (cytosine1402-N4)-methyltransferase